MIGTTTKKIVLLFTFQEIKPAEGISKKILAEQKAFQTNGYDCLLGRIEKTSDNYSYKIGDRTVINYEYGLLAKIKKIIFYKGLLQWIKLNRANIAIIYVRYTHFSNVFFCQLFKSIRKLGIKVALEIPTYPYDKEYCHSGLTSRILHWEEQRTRINLVKNIDRIVTFSNHDEIWNRKTIKINNAIDLTTIPVRTPALNDRDSIHLIGVANLMFWHGYDRIIESLNIFYKYNCQPKIYFHIVGGEPGNETYEFLHTLVEKYHLNDYVIFHGVKSGIDLDNLFNMADVAVGSLGCHRKGIEHVQALKNVEYAARGIPFIYSEENYLFDKSPYVFKVSADEEIIDFTKIITFLKNVNLTPEEIRDSVKELTWHNQMKKIIRLLQN